MLLQEGAYENNELPNIEGTTVFHDSKETKKHMT